MRASFNPFSTASGKPMPTASGVSSRRNHQRGVWNERGPVSDSRFPGRARLRMRGPRTNWPNRPSNSTRRSPPRSPASWSAWKPSRSNCSSRCWPAGTFCSKACPGVAKTTLSKVFARLLGCQYQRVQFTPDLLPSDVTGTSIFDRNANDFVLRKGPIFTQVLLADEINRAPAKTQAALLEAMQEYQVTVDGKSLPLTLPFMVLATQNPVEQEGVYRLPEAQLDRFLLRVEMGYPGFEHEVNLLKLHSKPLVEVQRDVHPETHPRPATQAARRSTGPIRCSSTSCNWPRRAGSTRTWPWAPAPARR